MPLRISLRNTDFFKEIQRYLTTMHGNQVPVIELSFIDNFSWKKLSLNLTREVAGLEQEEYMFEKCRDNKYFLINLATEVRNNDSVTKIWLCKVMSEKRGWQVTTSPPLNPPLHIMMGNLIQQDQLYEIHQWDWTITCIHNVMVITKITCIHQ